MLSARPADMSLSLREKITGHSNSKKAPISMQITVTLFILNNLLSLKIHTNLKLVAIGDDHN